MVVRKQKPNKLDETARLEARLAQANQVIENSQVVRFSMNDSLTCAQSLLEPAVPNLKAVEAAKRYKERMRKSAKG